MPQIGWAAPALLVAARLLQGLSLGGEYGASATYLSEAAGRERRGFYSSFQYVTLISGQLTALAGADDPAVLPDGGRSQGLGLADPLRDRRRAGAGRLLDPASPAETASFENARASGAPRSSGAACSAIIRRRRCW